jgi:hypothetical protein
MKLLLIWISVILLLPNFIDKDINSPASYNHKEKYDPSLAVINSIDRLEWYTDSIAIHRNIDPQSYEYFLLLEDIISQRFYHGFSHYTLKENWVAAFSQKLTDVGLACKVKPEDIMKDPMAACSQQAMVMMEIVKRKEANYRKIGFPHHYAMEVAIKDEWYFFDCNMEPLLSRDQRNHATWKGINDSLKGFYNASIHEDLDYQFGEKQMALIGTVNELPAKNLKAFHTATWLFSLFGWCIPLFALFFIKDSPPYKRFSFAASNSQMELTV